MHWLVSLPLNSSKDEAWRTLQQISAHDAPLSENHKFSIPELRVGTLDSLMVLSDDLVKVNALLESVVNKIRRQMFELAVATDETEEVRVEGMPPETYLERFAWDEAKYPPRRPLNETVSAITDIVQQLEDGLKVRVSEYNQLKGQLAALNRKRTGNLAVRDLAGLVDKEDAVATENLMSLFVVVPKTSKSDWLGGYERLSEYVVPRSSKQITEDNDYILFRVILFRRVADTFKAACRQSGYQVREYQVDEEKQAEEEGANTQLADSAAEKKRRLEQWSTTAYGEAFIAWIHVCAIRLFVESILRYGLPPRFLAVLMKPSPKGVAKLRKVLARTFGQKGHGHFDTDGEKGNSGLPSESVDMYPYVSFTVAID